MIAKFTLCAALFALRSAVASPSDTLKIGLRQAMDTARVNAISVQMAHSRSVEMNGKVGESRGALLPHFGAAVTDAVSSIDLPAEGFSSSVFGGGGAGPALPTLIKPFNAQDARLKASLSLIDVSAWKRYDAARREEEGGQWEEQAAVENAALNAAAAYLALARDRTLIRAREEELSVTEQLDSLTRAQKQAGAVGQVEVLRAEGLLSSAQGALATARGEEEEARYMLLRILGEDMGVYPELTDTLSLDDGNAQPDRDVLTQAFSSNPEVEAAGKQADAARAELGALKATLLPTLNISGDYGLIGRRLDGNAEWTETIALQLNWNLWDGGQRGARRGMQKERLRQAEIRQRDMRAEVEEELRVSSASMKASREQAVHSRDRVGFAQEEVRLAEERFRAGGSGNLEVITAQNSVSLAYDNYIDALYGYNRARLAFLRATRRLSEL